MDLDNMIQQINDYYEYRRVKRDGRQPSTGRFEPYQRSGVVKLRYCIETGVKDACVTIGDKTDYLKISQVVGEPVNSELVPPESVVDITININEEVYADSEMYLTDFFDESIDLVFQDKSGANITFTSGSTNFVADTRTGLLTSVNNGVYSLTNVSIKRNRAGSLICVGYNNASGIIEEMVMELNYFGPVL